MKGESSLTQDVLKDNLYYDPISGDFTWLLDKGSAKAGDTAGTTDSNGYLKLMLGGHIYFCHRLAHFYVYGSWPEGEIDHGNQKRWDNHFDNLRDVTRSENQRNRKLTK